MDPKINDACVYASWRALALGLLEYRRGNYSTAADRLQKCSSYPGEAPSCMGAHHVRLGTAWLRLRKTQEGTSEFMLGQCWSSNLAYNSTETFTEGGKTLLPKSLQNSCKKRSQ